MDVRRIARTVILGTGVVAALERFFRARESYQQWRLAVQLGDSSGAQGWRLFTTEQLVEGLLALVISAGFYWLLRPAKRDVR